MMEPTQHADTVRWYKKRPTPVEAVRITPENQLDVTGWCGGLCRYNELIEIHTLEGVMTAQMGDWVIRGVVGEFYPCKPNVFERTYEPIDGEQSDG